jgi:hypothetical protein
VIKHGAEIILCLILPSDTRFNRISISSEYFFANYICFTMFRQAWKPFMR